MTEELTTNVDSTQIEEFKNAVEAFRTAQNDIEQRRNVIEIYAQMSGFAKGNVNKERNAFIKVSDMTPQQFNEAVRDEKATIDAMIAEPQRPQSHFFDETKFLPSRMIETLTATQHFIALKSEPFIRIYQRGVYLPNDSHTIQRIIHQLLKDDLKIAHVQETLSLLRSHCMKELPSDGTFPFAHPGHINLKNGIYNIETKQLEPHSPDFISLIQIPVEYDPNAKCPEITRWLCDILENDKDNMRLAVEFIGYALLQALPIAKLLILLGPTHTGKSTYLNIIKSFLGARNTAGVALHALEDNNVRFARSSLYGKLANISSDLSAQVLKADGNIKALTAGDYMEVEAKQIPQFPMVSFATLFCATNPEQMPKSLDKGDAFYERIAILPFVKQHVGNQADRDYLKRLTTPAELSGLLNDALIGLHTLLQRGNFTETQSTKEAMREYRLENDIVLKFLEGHYERVENENEAVKEDEIFEHFKRWIDNENLDLKISKANFRKRTSAWLNVKDRSRPRQFQEDKKRPFGWLKIKRSDDADLYEDDTQTKLT